MIKQLLYRIFPNEIIKNRVLFESEGPYDNGYELFKYSFSNRKDLDCYFYTSYIYRNKIPKNFRKKTLYVFDTKNKYSHFFVCLRHPFLVLKYYKIKNTFSFVFSSYGRFASSNKETKKIYVFHGIGMKGAYDYFKSFSCSTNKIVVPTDFVKESFVKFYKESEEKFDVLPNQRISQLKFDSSINDNFRKFIKAGENKVLLVMTTFRRNADNTVNTKEIFPISIDFEKLNYKLKQCGVTMVVKLHHLLDGVDISKFQEFSNIVFLKNDVLFNLHLNPTSIMPYTDALISDYSSAVTDYLLLNRPIGFLIPDFKNYKTEINGGFIFENPLGFMPGMKFIDQDGLEEFICSLKKDDIFKFQREKISEMLNGKRPLNLNPEGEIISFYLPNRAEL